jgi:hypothetical protein
MYMSSERQPRWTAYACTRRRDRIFLAGENGQLYLFEVHQHSLLDAEGQQRRVNSSLLCAAEIPVEVRGNVYVAFKLANTCWSSADG